jgi:hypothetical protein
MDRSRLEGARKEENLCDTTDFEIRSMRNAFGSSLDPLLGLAGLNDLKTRSDIDHFVRSLQSHLGL